MVVNISLFKVRDDVDFLGDVMEGVPDLDWNETLEKYGFREDMTKEEMDTFFEKLENMRWSDNQSHYMIDKTWIKKTYRKGRGTKRLFNRLNKFNMKCFNNGKGYIYKYITVDPVFMGQTCGIKQRFFKKRVTLVYCTTRQEVNRFFKQYMDTSTKDGKEIADTITREWKDNADMILEIIW